MSPAEIFYHLVLLALGVGIGWVWRASRERRSPEVEPDARIEPLRGRLASLRTALETLEMYPDQDPQRAGQLRAIVREELGALGGLLDGGGRPASVPPRPADARGLVAALNRAAPGKLEISPPESGLVLAVDTAELAAAVGGVVSNLSRGFGVEKVEARLHREQDFLHLDLAWSHEGLDLDALCAWQSEAILAPTPHGGPGLKESARRHGGEAWFNLDRTRSRAYFRVLLPAGAG